MTRYSAAVLAIGALLIAPLLVAGPHAQETPALEIVDQQFGWVGADEEEGTAVYAWSVDVENQEADEHEIIVTLELLDADEQVVHSDARSVSVEAGSVETVQSQGSVSIDVATAVASFRNALRLPQASGR